MAIVSHNHLVTGSFELLLTCRTFINPDLAFIVCKQELTVHEIVIRYSYFQNFIKQSFAGVIASSKAVFVKHEIHYHSMVSVSLHNRRKYSFITIAL